MQKHTLIYLSEMNYSVADFIPCEVCGNQAQDIHHIDARGMGGDPQGKKDVIHNLMALCRNCHDLYGDYKGEVKEKLKSIHEYRMQERGAIL